MFDVVKTRPIVPKGLLEKFSHLAVATAHEAMGMRGAMSHEIKAIDPKMKTCGRALTVKCHRGDNLMLIKAIQLAQPGDVIVADMGDIKGNGPFGEVLAVECLAKGIAGLVVSCSVRDSEALIERGFPVFSTGICVFGTAKASKGTINHPVVVGGVLVRPGDIVLGDADGVAVVPVEEAENVLKLANAREEKERAVMERLSKGESLFDIYNYQEVFDRLNISEER